VAAALRDRGVRPGDAVALMLPTGFEFLAAFQGILLARAVPVPIYPPVRLDRIEEYAERQAAILADAGAAALLTAGRTRPLAALLRPRVPSLRVVETVAALLDEGGAWPGPDGDAADPAFIQYTSGSTGAPKGVLLTHANLVSNIRAISRGLDARPTDVGVSWLPLYHDMGLIGSWLFCMVDALPIDIQSPLAFLSRPERWLWAIHRRRATLSPAPNFAYELCARRIPEAALEGLDLSSWRVALNGAEPIAPETLERFIRRFEPYGFRREAMLPVYGLAENSVALAFPPLGRGPRVDAVRRAPFADAGRAEPAPADEPAPLRFVGVGTAVAGHEIRVVDDAGADVEERRVGRIVFRGPSAMAGYHGQPEATAAITLDGGWLDTGDLGYRADGELFVTGRRKDLVIKGGRNLVPQEIEEAAAEVEGVRRGCVVAFGVPRADLGTEALVVVAETRATDAARRAAIEKAVVERIATVVGVPPDAVVLVPPGAVPKTSSGKVRRAETRRLHGEGGLGARLAPGAATRARLFAAAAAAAAREWLTRAGRAAYLAWLAAAGAAVILPAWPLAVVASPRVSRRVQRAAARALLALSGCRATIEGAEHLRGPGPRLLACNHASYADVLALLALVPADFVFAAKREVMDWPLAGKAARRARHVPVEREDATRSVTDAGALAGALEEGVSLLVFPEGTFTAASGLRPFRLGVFRTAVETGAPLVPLALRGTRRALRDGAWPRPTRIHLWVGPPLRVEGSGWRAAVALRDRAAEAIAARCGEPRLDLVAAARPGEDRG
jgi:1-acyl-sn-glycerol-3-phosphate acyltransferase